MYQVTITTKDCRNRKFDCVIDDALAAATSRQTDIHLTKVFDGFAVDKKNNHYDFDPTTYSRKTFSDLKEGIINTMVVVLIPFPKDQALWVPRAISNAGSKSPE